MERSLGYSTINQGLLSDQVWRVEDRSLLIDQNRKGKVYIFFQIFKAKVTSRCQWNIFEQEISNMQHIKQ